MLFCFIVIPLWRHPRAFSFRHPEPLSFVIAGLLFLLSLPDFDPAIYFSKHILCHTSHWSNAVSGAHCLQLSAARRTGHCRTSIRQSISQLAPCLFPYGFSGANSHKWAPWHFAGSAILSGFHSACAAHDAACNCVP